MKIAFALSLLAAGVLLAVDNAETDSKAKIKLLQKELVETLKDTADAAERLARNARVSPIEAVRAQQAYFEAMLDTAETKQERITILENEIEAHKKIELLAEANRRGAQGTQLEIFKAKAARIKAEIALEKEKMSGIK